MSESEPQNVTPKNGGLSSSSVPPDFNARALNLTEEEVYLFPEDPNYEMIDMGRYALGKVLKDMINAAAIAQITNYAKINGVKTVTFDKIFGLFPGMKAMIDQKLSTQSLPSCPYDFSSFDKIQSVMSREGIDYNLGVYIYNLESNPGGEFFILTPGAELNDEEGGEDQIMAWYKGANLTADPIKITEGEAGTFATMGAFFSLVLDPKVLGPVGNGPTGPIGGPLVKKICVRQVNIKHRYEKSGKSEIYFHALKNTGGNNWATLYNNWPANDSSKHLTSTKSTNQWVTVDKGQVLFNSDLSVVWNTFERDWYSSFKPVNNLLGATTMMQSGAPMTFANEWYALVPSTNNLSNSKSMGPFKAPILTNGASNTYLLGEGSKFQAYFYAQ
ncbi:hypothetical protein [Flavobacterium cerinum]|uniref:Uncharacterized protein n=1 Tax=Flavobacterium cerinum TaxID=2502784 RepID=A0A3S3U2M5_9FLAO|nr:hypothetical protein [Flavobacterium cerinum]RWX03477.1 hypothetical protein EPI11_00680 [Flavobacterium cerinum]